MLKIPEPLQLIFDQFDACLRCQNTHNPLRHILGGGYCENPDYLFLFINPTHHNRSSHQEYAGKRRYPFIGVRYFWKLLSETGLIEPNLIQDIYKSGWQPHHETLLETNLIRKKIYLTNLVKCTQPHPENPDSAAIAADLPLLKREIQLVNPKIIVTFGKLPTRILTGCDIKLADILLEARQKNLQPLASNIIQNQIFSIFPCYFPIGRGNPTKAKELLRLIIEKNNPACS